MAYHRVPVTQRLSYGSGEIDTDMEIDVLQGMICEINEFNVVEAIPGSRSMYVNLGDYNVRYGPDNCSRFLVNYNQVADMSREDLGNVGFPVLPVTTGARAVSPAADVPALIASVLKSWNDNRRAAGMPNGVDDFVNRLPGMQLLCGHCQIYRSTFGNNFNGRMWKIGLCDGDAIARAYAAIA